MSNRSIAVAQTCPTKGDVVANLEEHVRLAQLAVEEGAQIVLFPELSLTGYELALANELAFSEDDPRFSPLRTVAASGPSTLIVGGPVRVAQRLHIGAFIISPDQTITLYTKHHLGAFSTSTSCDGKVPPAEQTVFQPGDHNPLLEYGGNTAAVAVCSDVAQSSHPKRAAERGARTYLACMFLIPSDFEREAAKLRSYAVQHSLAVAMANFGSSSGGLTSGGRSTIWSDRGERLAQLGVNGAGVAIVTEGRNGWDTKSIPLGEGTFR